MDMKGCDVKGGNIVHNYGTLTHLFKFMVCVCVWCVRTRASASTRSSMSLQHKYSLQSTINLYRQDINVPLSQHAGDWI
jgi:hypothetical protein